MHGMKRLQVFSLALLFVAAFSFGFYRGGERLLKIGQQLELFSEVYKDVNKVYADKVDPTFLMQTAIDTMLHRLDPYTVFVGESRIEDAKLIQTGRYSGIGATLSRHGQKIVVTQLVQDGPADKAGIKVGDELLKVDQEVVTDSSWTLEKIDNLIQGEQGASVSLTMIQDGGEKRWDIERDYVAALEGDVSYQALVKEGVGYIKLDGFGGRAAPEVKSAFEELSKESGGLKAVVLDLRGNLGGRVDQAIGILNLFLPKGLTVLEMRGSTPQHTRSFDTPFDPIALDIPLAVLVDHSSASASEIVAGAVQDLDRGVVIGEKSFGKGLVQNVRPLSYNTQFRITVAKYYTPSGRCIQAIDYGNRRPDGSLIASDEIERQEFFTKNGRKVYDGAGIEPDITLDFPQDPAVLKALKQQHMIFDFVTEFARRTDSLPGPKVYKLPSSEYKAFLSFLEDREFYFQPNSEKRIEELATYIEEDAHLKSALSQLENRVAKEKKDDLTKFEDEIKRALQQEIIKRYFYRSGIIESSFAQDQVVLKATDMLEDVSGYQKLLGNQ